MSLLNSILGSSGLGAKLMFILNIVELIRYLEINYSKEVLLIFETNPSSLISYNLLGVKELLSEKENLLAL